MVFARYSAVGTNSVHGAALCRGLRCNAVASPVQEALAHKLRGHVGDCALSGGLCWIMVHAAHAKVSNLHHTQHSIQALTHSLARLFIRPSVRAAL